MLGLLAVASCDEESAPRLIPPGGPDIVGSQSQSSRDGSSGDGAADAARDGAADAQQDAVGDALSDGAGDARDALDGTCAQDTECPQGIPVMRCCFGMCMPAELCNI